MKINCITTCSGELALRMLSLTYPFSKKIFNNFIVITKNTDLDVKNFCIENNIIFFETDLFSKNGRSFNRGAAINGCIDHFKFEDWICHIDCDILLEDNYRQILEKELIDFENFYSSRRVIVPTKKDLDLIFSGEKKEGEFLSYPGIGYGYLQIWNSKSSIVKLGHKYSEYHDIEEHDWIWRNLWGDCIHGVSEYTGKLRRINKDVLHLGEPNIKGAEKFFN